MNSESLRRLLDNLERRRSRLQEANDENFYPRIKRLWRFLHDQIFLRGTLASLEQRRANVGYAVNMVMGGQSPDERWIAGSDLDLATVAYNVLDQVVKSEEVYRSVKVHYAQRMHGQSLDNLKSELIQALFDYLVEALDEQQVTLGHLLRYAQRCEWFKRAELHDLAVGHKEEMKAKGKRSQVEELLKQDLYCICTIRERIS